MTIEYAKKQVINFVTANGTKLKEAPPVIIDNLTIYKCWGWVFYYNSKQFVETGDSEFSYIGNVPILVNKIDGTIETIWKSMVSIEDLIKEYEDKKKYSRKEDSTDCSAAPIGNE